MLDRSTRTFWGVGLLVTALLVVLWLIVRERPIDEWWLALLLVVLAGLLFLWGRRDAEATPQSTEPSPPRVHEFEIAAEPPVAMPAPAASVELSAVVPPAPVTAETPAPVMEEPDAPVMAAFAKADTASPTKRDNLLIIEGIGPKMDGALRAEGIDTYRKVADASVQDLRAAIERHGLTFAPSLVNWAKQARYLADGDLAGFETYRDYLIRGLEPGQVVSRDYVVSSAADAPTEPEKSVAKPRASKEAGAPKVKKASAPKPKKEKVEAPVVPDDLKVVEGIGPKMEKALNAAGILTFKQLSQANEATIRSAIEAAGMRFAPSVPTWARQAGFAAAGDMAGLKAYQDELTAGRAT